ncbi:unnamed protein product [Polarella glacialis]|uniref:Uncharacterized protein n=1 Tax=Polarella glacialis TaxID=89957 RepID=A0A813HQ96_POLGL|nr:unnamed protein product [Polarella glacialis]
MRALGLPAIQGCFTGFVNDNGDELTFEFCCLGTSLTGDRSGGSPYCWSHGATYERCCLGSHDAVHLQKDLTAYGDSWYGLSSVPDHPPKEWLDGLCLVSYARNRLTIGSLSPLSPTGPEGFYRSEGWPLKAAQSTFGFVIKCNGAHGILVFFRFNWAQYLAQHRGHALVEKLDNLLAESFGDDRTHLHDMACIPEECVAVLEAEEVIPPRRALRVVLWSYILERHLQLSRYQAKGLPAPLFEFFDQLYTYDATMSNLMTLDHLL